jgi:hydroxypyruvate isomerase
MQRREFMVQSASVGTAALAGAAAIGAAASAVAQDGPAKGAKFKLNLAPHFGMFEASAGSDLVDQLKYGADLGFAAWEDNWMVRRPVEEQEKIGKALADLGMTMGIFVCHADMGARTFAASDKNPEGKEAREKVVADIKQSVDVAKRLNAKWMTLVCDSYDPRLEWAYQMANCVDLLRRCAEIIEPHDLVMVAEPLNWRRDHPGLLLHTPALCYEACRGANSPAVKVLFDLYHTQIQCGNLIPNLDQCWDEIAYIQTGDTPGRNEPGTGEINYRNVFKHIHDKGYKGIVGLEHGVSKQGKEGEEALVAAYRAAEDF